MKISKEEFDRIAQTTETLYTMSQEIRAANPGMAEAISEWDPILADFLRQMQALEEQTLKHIRGKRN